MLWYKRYAALSVGREIFSISPLAHLIYTVASDMMARAGKGGTIRAQDLDSPEYLARMCNLRLAPLEDIQHAILSDSKDRKAVLTGALTDPESLMGALSECVKVGLIKQKTVENESVYVIEGFTDDNPFFLPPETVKKRKQREISSVPGSVPGQYRDSPGTVPGKREKREREKERKKEKKKHTSKAEHETFKTLWNSKADSTFARLSVLTEARAKAIERFLKAHKVEDFEAGIEKANKSSFLKGQGNTGFKASFDWILKSDNFVKLIEGNYDDRSTVSQPTKKPSITLTQEQIRKQYEPVDTSTYSPELKLQFDIPLTEEDKEYLQKMKITVR